VVIGLHMRPRRTEQKKNCDHERSGWHINSFLGGC
jgi:hypothetical protein